MSAVNSAGTPVKSMKRFCEMGSRELKVNFGLIFGNIAASSAEGCWLQLKPLTRLCTPLRASRSVRASSRAENTGS